MGSTRRHRNFYLALGLGVAIALLSMALPMGHEVRALLAVDSFAVIYLGLILRMTFKTTPHDLRLHAEDDDEGILLTLLLAVVAVAVSLTAIFVVLNRPEDTVDPVAGLLALAAVPLGWAMVHTLAGLHYSFLYYSRDPDGGLIFPDTPNPGLWDFHYFSFCIGMAAQVSDVNVSTTDMRRAVLLHGVGSFFYNAVILALAVNAAMAFAG